MKIAKTSFKDLIIIKNKSHKDKRGYFKELLRENEIRKKFPFLVMSYSKRNVIRGLHLQQRKSQGKFVTVIKGKIYDVVIDLRKKSKTFGKKYSVILSDKNCKSIYVPEGFAHGFCALDKDNYVVYSCTNYRAKQSEIGIKFDDKKLNINWPTKTPTLSKKDRENLSLIKFLELN